MSYTTIRLVATCTISSHITLENLAQGITDYLGNHEEDLNALPGLSDLEAGEICDEIKKYLSLNGEELMISCDTDGHQVQGTETEVAEFLCNHIAYLQTSAAMQVTWVSNDTRDGLSVNSYFLSQGGEVLDAAPGSGKRDLTDQIADILWPGGATDHEWSPDTLEKICQLYVALRPDLVPNYSPSSLQ